jgi:hypothetical protein
MDSVYDIKEEMGSKKTVSHVRRSKNATNAPVNHQPSPCKRHREPSPSSVSLSSTPQPSSSSRGDGGDDDANDGDEEEEGNEQEVESADEDLEYNSRVVMYPIDVMSAPKNQKSWREDHFRDFHEACDLKKFNQPRTSPYPFFHTQD